MYRFDRGGLGRVFVGLRLFLFLLFPGVFGKLERLLEVRVVLLVLGVVAFFEPVQVLVRVAVRVAGLDDGDGGVRTVVRHTGTERDIVVEDDTGVAAAVAVTEAVDVPVLDGLGQVVDDLLEGLDFGGQSDIVVLERVDGHLQDLTHRGVQDRDLFISLVREHDFAFDHVLRVVDHVDAVVADPLELTDTVEDLVDLVVDFIGQFAGRQADEDGVEAVLEDVEAFFTLVDLVELFLGVFLESGQGSGEGLVGEMRHLDRAILTLTDDDVRRVVQTLVDDETAELFFGLFALLSTDDLLDQFDDELVEGEQDEDHRNVVDRMDGGDGHRVDGLP